VDQGVVMLTLPTEQLWLRAGAWGQASARWERTALGLSASLAAFSARELQLCKFVAIEQLCCCIRHGGNSTHLGGPAQGGLVLRGGASVAACLLLLCAAG